MTLGKVLMSGWGVVFRPGCGGLPPHPRTQGLCDLALGSSSCLVLDWAHSTAWCHLLWIFLGPHVDLLPHVLRDVFCVSFPGIKLCLPRLVSVLMSMLWSPHRKCPQRRWNPRLQSRDPRPGGFT